MVCEKVTSIGDLIIIMLSTCVWKHHSSLETPSLFCPTQLLLNGSSSRLATKSLPQDISASGAAEARGSHSTQLNPEGGGEQRGWEGG